MEEVVISSAFWRQRRVFVTGHTGFKGSWLSLMLQRLDARVTGYALAPPTTPSLYDLQDVSATLDDRRGDIADVEALRAAMVAAGPEILIHMAAQPLVLRGYQDPVETYRVNVMGTVALLEAVRAAPSVRTVLVVTTDMCYENKEWPWGYREVEPMGGFDPYSNSKGCSELVSAAYRSSFFNPADHAHHGVALATARAGNVIGGGDWARDRLIPDILEAFAANRAVQIRNPHATRPWQHVLEPLHGYLTLAERLHTDGSGFAEAWNFGPDGDDVKPVEWIVKQLARCWGQGATWQVDRGDHPHEANYLKLDISKAAQRLRWRPVLCLGEALGLVVDWSRAKATDADMRAYTLEQIATYQRRVAPNPT